jgi:hypothetical protein
MMPRATARKLLRHQIKSRLKRQPRKIGYQRQQHFQPVRMGMHLGTAARAGKNVFFVYFR